VDVEPRPPERRELPGLGPSHTHSHHIPKHVVMPSDPMLGSVRGKFRVTQHREWFMDLIAFSHIFLHFPKIPVFPRIISANINFIIFLNNECFGPWVPALQLDWRAGADWFESLLIDYARSPWSHSLFPLSTLEGKVSLVTFLMKFCRLNFNPLLLNSIATISQTVISL